MGHIGIDLEHIAALEQLYFFTALEMGNRTLMMDDGNIVLDLSGDERTNLTVEGLLQKYRDVKGQMLDNDRILLSQ